MSPLDSKALVVRPVVSCLGVISEVGRNVRVCGIKNCGKGVIWRNIAGICLSKGPGIQHNHEHRYCPKNVVVMLPICGKRILTTGKTVR